MAGIINLCFEGQGGDMVMRTLRYALRKVIMASFPHTPAADSTSGALLSANCTCDAVVTTQPQPTIPLNCMAVAVAS